mgnify:CR=1 FL=1
MSVSLVINGQTYFYPETRDVGWGAEATDWASAVTVGMLQKAGGLFQLLAEVDFGTSYGIKSLYLKSRTSNVADSGQIRLAVSDVINFRNNANSGNLPLGINGSDQLTFNSVALASASLTDSYIFVGNASNIATGVAMSGDITITNAGVTAIGAGVIVNNDVSNSAAIAYSKLNLASSIVNADVSNSAAIAYSKLNLATSIVNADISASAAIAYSKLNLATSIVNADISASAAIAYSKLNLATSIVNADISASAAIARSKVAAGTASHVVINDGSGNLSSEAQLAGSRGGSGASNSGTFTWGSNNITFTTSGATSLTLPTSGTVLTSSSLNLANNQNYVMNGDFNIWQTGTSFSSIADGTYFADGFLYIKTTSTTVNTIARDTGVPTVTTSVTQFKYSAKLTVGTADASVAAGDRVMLQAPIEGSFYKFIHDKQVTLSFWVYATKTGTSCVAFRNGSGNRSYVAEYTISSSNTWEFKTITLTTDASGAWDFTDGTRGMDVNWALMMGSTYQTTAGSWQAGNYLATSSQVNHVDNTSNIFAITGVKLNLGSSATDFSLAAGTPAGELAFCQRYCQKSYNDSVAPGTASTSVGICNNAGLTATAGGKILSVSFQEKMMSTPTVTLYDYAGNSGKISTLDTSLVETNNVTPNGSTASQRGFYVYVTGSTVCGLEAHYVATARV